MKITPLNFPRAFFIKIKIKQNIQTNHTFEIFKDERFLKEKKKKDLIVKIKTNKTLWIAAGDYWHKTAKIAEEEKVAESKAEWRRKVMLRLLLDESDPNS